MFSWFKNPKPVMARTDSVSVQDIEGRLSVINNLPWHVFCQDLKDELIEMKTLDLFDDVSRVHKSRHDVAMSRFDNVSEPVFQIIDGIVKGTIKVTESEGMKEKTKTRTKTITLPDGKEITITGYYHTPGGHRFHREVSAAWLTCQETTFIMASLHSWGEERDEKANQIERQSIIDLLSGEESGS